MKIKRYAACCLAAITVLAVTACGKETDNDSKAVNAIPVPTETTAATTEITSADTSTLLDSVSSADDTSMASASQQSVSAGDSSVFDESSSQGSTIKVSADWTDMEFVFDNRKIKLGESCYRDFLDNGWEIDMANDPVFCDEYGMFSITDNIDSIPAGWITVFVNRNYQNDPSWPIYPHIRTGTYSYDLDMNATWDILPLCSFSMEVEEFLADEYSYPNVILCGSISFGDDYEKIISLLGQPDSEKELDNMDARTINTKRYERNLKNNIDMNIKTKTLTYTSGDKSMILTIDSDIGLKGFSVYDFTGVAEKYRRK